LTKYQSERRTLFLRIILRLSFKRIKNKFN
jgi:hypothetical protein